MLKKGARTRAAILDVAARHFEQEGYVATRIEDIVAELELTKGAFYFHFTSKEDLAFRVIEHAESFYEEFVEQALAEDLDPLQRIYYVIERMAVEARRNVFLSASLTLVRWDIAASAGGSYSVWREQFEADLCEAADSGLLADGVHVADAADLIVTLVVGSEQTSAALTGRSDMRDRFHHSWLLVLNALAADPAAAAARLPSHMHTARNAAVAA